MHLLVRFLLPSRNLHLLPLRSVFFYSFFPIFLHFRSVTITGLHPGSTYRFQVFATNGVSSLAGPPASSSIDVVTPVRSELSFALFQLLCAAPVCTPDPTESSKVTKLRVQAVTSSSANFSWSPAPSNPASDSFQLQLCSPAPKQFCKIFNVSRTNFLAKELLMNSLYIVRVSGWLTFQTS